MLVDLMKKMFRRGAVGAVSDVQPDANIAAARQAYEAGDAQRAIDILARVIAREPNDSQARVALAGIYRRKGRVEPAMAQLEQVLRLQPNLVPALEQLGLMLHATGESVRALELYNKAVALAPDKVDDWFDTTYRRGLQQTTTSPFPLQRRQRFHFLSTLFEQAVQLPGDIAECGCYRGLSSYMLCSVLKKHDPRFDGRSFHIFDSFAGLSKPIETDTAGLSSSDRVSEMCREGAFAANEQLVRRNLREFPAIATHKGWIPESFVGVPEATYRFVHVDVDLYEPTRASFEYFFPRLCAGGIIVCDDYNWPGAKKAVDEFAAVNKIEVHITPAGQAYFMKSI